MATQQEIVAASGSTLLKRLPLVNAAAIQLPVATAPTALEYLSRRPEVKKIYADPQVSAQSETEGVASQLLPPIAPPPPGPAWNILQIARHQVASTIQGQGVEIAVLDTGIDTAHPALSGVVIGGYNAVTTGGGDLSASGQGGDGQGGDTSRSSCPLPVPPWRGSGAAEHIPGAASVAFTSACDDQFRCADPLPSSDRVFPR